MHECLRSKIFTVKLYLLEVRQCLCESFYGTSLAKLKDIFCTILIHPLLKIISLMSVVAGISGIGVMGCLSPSFPSLICKVYSVRLY